MTASLITLIFMDRLRILPENSYERLYSNHEPVKKTGAGKMFMKAVAAVAALAIVSVSSVEMYKLFGQNDIRLLQLLDTSFPVL